MNQIKCQVGDNRPWMARVTGRPVLAEERRVPTRLHRVGECPAQMVLVTFAETKVTRVHSTWKLLLVAFGDPGIASLHPGYGPIRRAVREIL